MIELCRIASLSFYVQSLQKTVVYFFSLIALPSDSLDGVSPKKSLFRHSVTAFDSALRREEEAIFLTWSAGAIRARESEGDCFIQLPGFHPPSFLRYVENCFSSFLFFPVSPLLLMTASRCRSGHILPLDACV